MCEIVFIWLCFINALCNINIIKRNPELKQKEINKMINEFINKNRKKYNYRNGECI